MIFRASEIHLLMGSAKSIDESLMCDEVVAIKKITANKRTAEQKKYLDDLLFNTLSETAKGLVKEKIRSKLHNAPFKFKGCKETEKGNEVEDDAIQFLMQHEFVSATKNTTRFTNDWVTGEPDVISDIIYDTKCPWWYWTMPYFNDEVEDKSVKAGYDWQQLCYLWLLRENNSHDPVFINEAQLKYILMPTPNRLLTRYDSSEDHIDFVLNLDDKDRISTYSIKWDAAKVEMIKTKILAARKYAETLEQP